MNIGHDWRLLWEKVSKGIEGELEEHKPQLLEIFSFILEDTKQMADHRKLGT